jgi:hypothetical protein
VQDAKRLRSSQENEKMNHSGRAVEFIRNPKASKDGG